MVSSLINPITKWWRVNTVRATFLPFKADTILKIPLSHNLLEDKIIWIRSSCEVFTVKSAYHLAHNLLESNAREECSNGNLCKQVWRKLWHLLSQQKSKFLLGEHVSMVYPQWRPLTTGGFPNLRLAQCVEMKLKV